MLSHSSCTLVLQSKLIRQFSRQLVAKRKCPDHLSTYPQLKKWLEVVGLTPRTIKALTECLNSFDDLLKCDDLVVDESRIKTTMKSAQADEDETRKIITAIRNLKLCTSRLIEGRPIDNVDLHWDSWDRNQVEGSSGSSGGVPNQISSNMSSPSTGRSRKTRPSETDTNRSSPLSPPHSATSRTAPWSPAGFPSDVVDACNDHHRNSSPSPVSEGSNSRKVSTNSRPTTTPPPARKHQTKLLSEPFPLTKSLSHEDQLSHRIENADNFVRPDPIDRNMISHAVTSNSFNSLSLNHASPCRRRLATEPGLRHMSNSPIVSPSRSPPPVSPDQSDSCFEEITPPVPRSPRAHGGMAHVIHHRFSAWFKVTSVPCYLCEKPMYYGLRCKECKYKCHRDCEDKVPPSCGLPQELVAVFKQTIQQNQSLSSGSHSGPEIMSPASIKSDGYRSGRRDQRHHRDTANSSAAHPTIAITPFGGADSSSNTSSCTSSSPSSPALLGPGSSAPTPNSASQSQTFAFPDVPGHHHQQQPQQHHHHHHHHTHHAQNFASQLVDTRKSNDSDRTMSVASGSTDSQRTLAGRIDSQDSQVSLDDDRNWPRQNSLTSKEWEIPFDELKIEEVIGTGRFGTVFRGQWHGAVAVKRLNMNAGIDDRRALEAFRQEVAMFRKTRHDNLVLFMGACMKPPQLAIVTSLCKGATLYTHLHHMKTKFPPSKALLIAQHICQGMSYLHARDIIHKDLKTKNIFYENGKVVITDFGLFSVTKLCQGNRSVACPFVQSFSYFLTCCHSSLYLFCRKGDWLTIPKGWLCYLSPEIMRCLKPGDQENDDLPFTAASDVFAFG